MLTGLATLLLLLWIPTAYSQELTGGAIIKSLNFGSTRYQDFTNQAESLSSSSNSSAAQTLVDEYHTYIEAQGFDGEVPQLPAPFSEVVQYGVEAAAHAISLEDRRSLAAFAAKKDFFTSAQQKSLYQDISKQVTIIAQFLIVTSKVTPEVQHIVEADYKILRETVVKTAATFVGSY